ncbi:MAG TPA: hypothetical protein H9915_08395 [Candidatus Gemmiger faecigallinarum]|nr:hypothetical protein [Candidatus Gemmiger faecigallinarum]
MQQRQVYRADPDGYRTPRPSAPTPVRRSAGQPPRPAESARPAGAPRKKKPGLIRRFFVGLARRLYFGGKTIFKFALLAPILVFMVAFSYNVDCSGLFQGALAPRRIVDLMLQGYDVTNYDQMDERQVVQLYAQDVPEAPEVIGIGSSRVLQFTSELVGSDSFFNMGVTGADVRDNMTSYYKMVTYGKTPQVLIWSVDPWVFYNSEAAFDDRADAELYDEFLTNVLGVETDYEAPDQVELWKALAEPAYFQGNVDYYFKNRGQSTITDEDGNPIDFNPVEGDPMHQTSNIKRADGSVLYFEEFRERPVDQVLADAAAASTTFNSVHMEGFDAMSDTQCQAFDAFIRYARSQGTTVILVLSPWHPYLYNYLLTEPELHQGFFQVEAWVRQYCAENGIPLYGSYDPTLIEGLEESDFFDGLHCKGSGIAKFFPGVPTVLQQIQNGGLPDPLAVSARVTSEAPEPEGAVSDAGEAADA